ncbi:MAG: hypothetical protein NPIRA02_18300 [Nitrospirales bacterium]|nr:MAG: hypothetical protein NPIRA02_18300 [Nitrospirales bacterium]
MQTNLTSHNGVTEQNKETPHCPRCQGLLVKTDYMDMLQGGYLWGSGQRCVNCGHLMDPKILLNQFLQQVGPKNPPTRKRQRNDFIAA